MYRFIPASQHAIGVFVAIAGGSVSGKTLTALRIARGIAGRDGKILAIDTEGGRMSMYSTLPGEAEVLSKKYQFDSYQMKSPFHPAEFANAIEAAEGEGAAVCVVDSFSLEWQGVGGVLDMQRQELARLQTPPADADPDWRAPRDASGDAWRFAKLPHKLMRDRLIQSSMPVIFCIRANTVLKHYTANPRAEGRWKAEQDERWIYEWTIALTLHPDTPGQPRYDLKTPKHVDAWKMPQDFAPFFPPGKFITEEAGAKIQEWRIRHSNTTRRSVRDIVRDRCAAAADADDVAAIEQMEPVKNARLRAPAEVNAEINVMLNDARVRIAKELAASQDTAQRGLDDQAARGEPDQAADDDAELTVEDRLAWGLAELARCDRTRLPALKESEPYKEMMSAVVMDGTDEMLGDLQRAAADAARREPGVLV
jgi:hypothetical protein